MVSAPGIGGGPLADACWGSPRLGWLGLECDCDALRRPGPPREAEPRALPTLEREAGLHAACDGGGTVSSSGK